MVLAGVVSGCGGGGSSDSQPGNASNSLLVSTSADSGVAISPTSVSVAQGQQATFTISTQAGFALTSLSGCGGTFAGNTYTTSPITAPCTVVATSKSAYVLNFIRLKPNALFSDEFASTPFVVEASVNGATGLKIYAEYLTQWFDRNAPPGVTRIPMFDDGTHGDRVAGDGIYTASVVAGQTPLLRFHDNTVDRFPINVTAYDAAGIAVLSSNSINPGVQLGVVSRAMAVATTRLAPDVFAAPNVVNIALPDPAGKNAAALQKLYQYYPDVFDGFAIHLVGTTSGINVPTGGGVKNTVQGINLGIFDNSSNYGIAGALSNGVLMAGDIIGEGFLHEFGHAYAFYLNNPSLELTGRSNIHVGPSSMLGQMGNSAYLSEQPSGDFYVGNPPDNGQYTGRQYADLELYLMGFMPPQNVGPEYFVVDPSVSVAATTTVPRAKVLRVTIDDVIRVYGQRVPSVANSPKAFRFVFVALSDVPASPAEIAIINRMAAFYESNSVGGQADSSGLTTIVAPRTFRNATKGLASMTTRLPAPK